MDQAIDAANARLICQILLEELNASSSSRQAQAGNLLADQTASVSLLRREIENELEDIDGRQMALSLARACESDADMIQRASVQQNDRHFAESMARAIEADAAVIETRREEDNLASRQRPLTTRRFIPVPPPPLQYADDLDDESLMRLATLNTPSEEEQCIVCGDDKPKFDIASTPCGHHYCRDCLRNLFEHSSRDQSLFPPRCCRQPIEVRGYIALALPRGIREEHDEKQIEFSTPNPTYCSNTACGRFIHPERIVADHASCVACDTVTCAVCKSSQHAGDCPQDFALQAVLELAQQEGWTRCFNCRRMVELTLGCYHMT